MIPHGGAFVLTAPPTLRVILNEVKDPPNGCADAVAASHSTVGFLAALGMTWEWKSAERVGLAVKPMGI